MFLCTKMNAFENTNVPIWRVKNCIARHDISSLCDAIAKIFSVQNRPGRAISFFTLYHFYDNLSTDIWLPKSSFVLPMIGLQAIIHELLRLLVKQTECILEASNIYLLFRHFSLTPLIWVGFDCFWKKGNTDFNMCVLSCPNRRRMLRRQLPLSHSPHCGPWGQHPSSREYGDLHRQGQGQWGSQVPATGVHHWTDGETGRGWSFWSLQKVFFRGDL